MIGAHRIGPGHPEFSDLPNRAAVAATKALIDEVGKPNTTIEMINHHVNTVAIMAASQVRAAGIFERSSPKKYRDLQKHVYQCILDQIDAALAPPKSDGGA